MDTMVALINLTFSFKGRRENMVNRGKWWVKIVELFLWLFQYSRFGSVYGLREECRKGAFRRESLSFKKEEGCCLPSGSWKEKVGSDGRPVVLSQMVPAIWDTFWKLGLFCMSLIQLC